MSRLLFLIIMAICVVAFGVVWYTHRSNIRSLTSGAVVVHDEQSDKAKTDLATPETGTSARHRRNSTHRPQQKGPIRRRLKAPWPRRRRPTPTPAILQTG